MKQQYEHKFMYFLLINIVKLTYNEEYIFPSFVVEIKTSRVSNTIFLIHQIKLLTNIT